MSTSDSKASVERSTVSVPQAWKDSKVGRTRYEEARAFLEARPGRVGSLWLAHEYWLTVSVPETNTHYIERGMSDFRDFIRTAGIVKPYIRKTRWNLVTISMTIAIIAGIVVFHNNRSELVFGAVLCSIFPILRALFWRAKVYENGYAAGIIDSASENYPWFITAVRDMVELERNKKSMTADEFRRAMVRIRSAAAIESGAEEDEALRELKNFQHKRSNEAAAEQRYQEARDRLANINATPTDA